MKALILAPFDPPILQRLKQRLEVFQESWTDTRRLISPEELVERIEKYDLRIVVIEADFIFEDVFEGTDKLRLIGVCRGSVTNVDVEAATRHNILVVNTPARNAVSVAELTIGLMLSLARRIPAAHSMVVSREWIDPVGPYISLRGIELSGKVAGIIGLGAIGSEVARRLCAFGMTVLGYDPYADSSRLAQLGVKQVSLDELMAGSDFITIHSTVSSETTGLIDKHMIGLMKPGAYLVNTAGWGIVDEDALLQALTGKCIAGAAFDTFETHPVSTISPLLKLDNVILTPHIGGATDGTVRRYSQMIAEDIERFITGKRPVNLVNPEAWQADDC